MTHHAENIHHICSHSKVNANLAAAACKIIAVASENERVDLFVRFLYECKYTPTDATEEQYDEFKGDVPKGELVATKRKIDKFISINCRDGVSENEFHSKLYQFILCESDGDPKKQAPLVMGCLLNSKLPYVNKASALRMSQEEFEADEGKIDQLAAGMLKHLSRQKFEQVTELASKYVPILDMVTEQKEKAILLALMLIRFRAETHRPSLESLLDD